MVEVSGSPGSKGPGAVTQEEVYLEEGQYVDSFLSECSSQSLQ